MLYKAFGLRFIIRFIIFSFYFTLSNVAFILILNFSVTGVAGKFDVMPLMLTIGAGFGLMSLSVIIADCVMLHCIIYPKSFDLNF